MRFSLFIVLAVLALTTVATGAGVASPQPTTNGTDTPNATATPTASTTTAATISPTTTPTATPTAAPTPTGTPRPTADDVLDDVDPSNATLDDVRTVAEWVRSEGADRSDRQADRARRWLSNATGGAGNISLPNISLGGDATATPAPTATPTPTAVPAPEGDSNVTRIDENTAIVASEYVPKKGIAKVTVRSETVQTIVFWDAGFLADGSGEGRSRSESFGPGEEATVAIRVTEANGRAAVGIGTEETPLYGVIVKSGGGGLDVLDVLTSIQALLTGVGVAFIWMLIAGWNELRGERGRPEVA
ncbi:hypothetical protein C475_00570 [Halosimplex carlsbadense 2-9-1]|uniref:Uncharacterized protein n=1 Tax=Halosimplex carlsbadense 2-9-1 TaxID=797114 RepID=M0D564_9EURY|nr:hypothetical protein [Halosimplex carlsbadense]ELZ30590.1 hypothetical protein C475_00570 [Halosimplex carlsbadense 2-9-1]